jgi:hypothetical protein
MPSFNPKNDSLLYLLGLTDDLDPLNTDGTPKRINNATVTWQIRSAAPSNDGTAGGVLVASGAGVLVPSGKLANSGNYYMELSNAIAFLAASSFWYQIVAIAGTYRGQWDGSFAALIRSGQSPDT